MKRYFRYDWAFIGTVVLWAVFILWAINSRAEQFPGVVQIPTKAGLVDFPRELRYELELLADVSLEEALERQYFLPGQTVDFNSPVIRFVREWNAWVKKRIENVNLRNSQDFLDAAEIIQRNRAEDAWVVLVKAQEEEFQQWKRVKKAGNRVLKALR